MPQGCSHLSRTLPTGIAGLLSRLLTGPELWGAEQQRPSKLRGISVRRGSVRETAPGAGRDQEHLLLWVGQVSQHVDRLLCSHAQVLLTP